MCWILLSHSEGRQTIHSTYSLPSGAHPRPAILTTTKQEQADTMQPFFAPSQRPRSRTMHFLNSERKSLLDGRWKRCWTTQTGTPIHFLTRDGGKDAGRWVSPCRVHPSCEGDCEGPLFEQYLFTWAISPTDVWLLAAPCVTLFRPVQLVSSCPVWMEAGQLVSSYGFLSIGGCCRHKRTIHTGPHEDENRSSDPDVNR